MVLALAIALGLAILPYLGWIIGTVVVLAVTVGAVRILLAGWSATVEKLRPGQHAVAKGTESNAVVVEADRSRHAHLIDLVILGTAGVILTGLAILSAIALNYGGAVLLGVVSAPILLTFFRRWRGVRKHIVLHDVR